MVTALLLCLACAAASAPPHPVPAGAPVRAAALAPGGAMGRPPGNAPGAIEAPARVELLEGRASLVNGSGIRELASDERELWVEGDAYIELRARTRVALRWNATASMIVHGPAALEWGPVEGSPTLLEWRFAQLDEVHLEVRRGPVRMAFPGGWNGSVESGAGFVRGLPSGGVEWHHDAGLPILLQGPHERTSVRPPWVVLAGAWLRLNPGLSYPELLRGSEARLLDPYARAGSSPTQRGGALAWTSFRWPWNADGSFQLDPSATVADPAPVPELSEAFPEATPGEPGTGWVATESEPSEPIEPAAAETAPNPAVRRAVPDGLFIPLEESSRASVPPPGTDPSEAPESFGLLLSPTLDPASESAEGPGEPVSGDLSLRTELDAAERSVPAAELLQAERKWRPLEQGGTLRLTPWGVRRFRAPTPADPR